MKKISLVTFFLAVSGVAIWNILQNRSGNNTKEQKDRITQVDSDSEVNSNNYSNSDKLTAYDLAADFVKRSLREPASAEFPGRKRLRHVKSLGNRRYKIDSWVDSRDTYGAMRRRNYSLTFRINDSGILKEEFVIEKIGRIP